MPVSNNILKVSLRNLFQNKIQFVVYNACYSEKQPLSQRTRYNFMKSDALQIPALEFLFE